MDKRKINRLLYLETVLTSLIHHAVEEELKDQEVDTEKLKDSLIYHMNDQI